MVKFLGTNSTQRCYLCGATSKEFNDIDNMLQKEIDESNLKFGLSTLHAWIRFFECLLHLSYKLDVKKWQVRAAEDKEKVSRNKKRIQEAFKEHLGLIVDKPKQGYGSSNDGNTARRFFENSAISSAITGVDENIILSFRNILLVLSSGFKINCEKFKLYAITVAKNFVRLYPWYFMPTTLHKILIHSYIVISSAILPIGQLSEEAQEARNKDIRNYREGFSRKFSRTQNMEDIFYRLLVSSDPYISSLRKLPKKKLKYFPTDVLQLLESPDIDELPNDNFDSDEDISQSMVSSESNGEGEVEN